MNLFKKVKNISLAAAFSVASMVVIAPSAHADDPVLLGQLDKVTDQNLQSENAQIQAAKEKNTKKK